MLTVSDHGTSGHDGLRLRWRWRRAVAGRCATTRTPARSRLRLEADLTGDDRGHRPAGEVTDASRTRDDANPVDRVTSKELGGHDGRHRAGPIEEGRAFRLRHGLTVRR